METDPDRWIAAVRHSHDALRALAGPLTAGQLQQRSYDTEWSIVQVLSHLGSQAEFYGRWLEAGLTGQDPPGQEVLESGPELRLPAEALIRLVYGRLDPAHTPPVEARGVDLDGLRPIFPGI